MGIPVDVMKELVELPEKDWPTCHLAKSGKYYAHDGDGIWDELTGPIYRAVGTPEQLADLRKRLGTSEGNSNA
jgi:hypothetical protein